MPPQTCGRMLRLSGTFLQPRHPDHLRQRQGHRRLRHLHPQHVHQQQQRSHLHVQHQQQRSHLHVQHQQQRSHLHTVGNSETIKRIETSPTLILNADYTPISIAPLSLLHWRDAMRAVYLGKATVVSEYEDLYLRSVSVVFPLPSVIALKCYQVIPSRKPVLTRRNIMLRDSFKCCYCGCDSTSDKLTLDHVTPKSKGGKTSWDNIVAACVTCNQKKGSASLRELPKLGMRLLFKPRVPTLYDLQVRRRSSGLDDSSAVSGETSGSGTLINRGNENHHPHWKNFTFGD